MQGIHINTYTQTYMHTPIHKNFHHIKEVCLLQTYQIWRKSHEETPSWKQIGLGSVAARLVHADNHSHSYSAVWLVQLYHSCSLSTQESAYIHACEMPVSRSLIYMELHKNNGSVEKDDEVATGMSLPCMPKQFRVKTIKKKLKKNSAKQCHWIFSLKLQSDYWKHMDLRSIVFLHWQNSLHENIG